MDIKDCLLKIYQGDENVDVEFEVKKFGEIFIEIGNTYCDYFNGSGKDEEKIKFNFENEKTY